MVVKDFCLLFPAEEYLTFAFEKCHRESHKNKRLILIYLIPVKMLLVRLSWKCSVCLSRDTFCVFGWVLVESHGLIFQLPQCLCSLCACLQNLQVFHLLACISMCVSPFYPVFLCVSLCCHVFLCVSVLSCISAFLSVWRIMSLSVTILCIMGCCLTVKGHSCVCVCYTGLINLKTGKEWMLLYAWKTKSLETGPPGKIPWKDSFKGLRTLIMLG